MRGPGADRRLDDVEALLVRREAKPVRPLHVAYGYFFFNATPTTEIYTLSLHDALPIFIHPAGSYRQESNWATGPKSSHCSIAWKDRKSTRLNSSHPSISYAVFCLKKKKKNNSGNISIKKANKKL